MAQGAEVTQLHRKVADRDAMLLQRDRALAEFGSEARRLPFARTIRLLRQRITALLSARG